MLVETKARVGVFAIALGAYLPQFPTTSCRKPLHWSAIPIPRT